MRLQRGLRVSDDLPLRAVMGVGSQIAGATFNGARDAPALRDDAARRGLTDEQEQAVARRAEPLLLSAAAGSGKTSVLVERFVRAVREDGLAPAKILAITFTERAAGELRERVRARLLELGEREAARDTEAAFVGTFHSFCARLLRAHPLMAGLDPEFTILDEGLAGRLREGAFSAALRALLRGERAEVVELLGAYGVDRVQAMIGSVYAELRSRGQRLPALPASTPARQTDPLDAEAAAACRLLDELLVGFGRSYERLKRGRGAVDFDDLELCALDLLEGRESVRAAWSERFELLMVDEFQDTNQRQLRILAALDRDNLFTVGDELQSIYSFRHADVGLFRARRADLAGRERSLALTRNFRSRPQLLDVVNALFAERFAGFTAMVAAREQSERGAGADAREGRGEPAGIAEPRVELLLTEKCGWERREELARSIALGLPAAALWRQAEARLLAQRVAELVEAERARAGDIAVLLRSLKDLEVYERALQQRGLNTLAAVGGFWERQQVGDLLAYLQTLANPLDESALYATLASPLVGLSRDGLALLARAAQAAGHGAWETALRVGEPGAAAALADDDRALLGDFCVRLQSERRTSSQRTVSELIERAIDASGYRDHVLGLDSGERRMANVHKLLRLARRFEASEGRDLRAFLDHVAYLKDARGLLESDAPVNGAGTDAVRLMSIHAAKGLEFPVVCVADLGRAPNTRVPDLLVDGDRLGLALMRLDAEKPLPSLQFEELCDQRRQAEAEEEDRIVYVAMTRARERLVLSGALDFERSQEQRSATGTISWLAGALAGPLLNEASAEQREFHDLKCGGSRVRCRLNAPAGVGSVLHLDGPAGVRRRSSPERGAGPRELGVRPRERGPWRREAGAPRRDAAPPCPERADWMATLSYTSLSKLERCGYRYYLERVLGLEENLPAARRASGSGGAALPARARGRLLHRLLESLDFTRPGEPPPERIGALAAELGIALAAEDREEIATLIGSAGCSALAARLAAAVSVRREHQFAFSLGADEPLLIGVIDLLAREADDGLVLVDYKSDRVGGGDDLDALAERDYGVQRLVYALAVLRDGAPSVEVVHWFLHRPDDPVAVRYGAAERAELERRLAELIGRARASAFAVSPSPHRGLCETCPGRAGLCSYSDAETMREAPGA